MKPEEKKLLVRAIVLDVITKWRPDEITVSELMFDAMYDEAPDDGGGLVRENAYFGGDDATVCHHLVHEVKNAANGMERSRSTFSEEAVYDAIVRRGRPTAEYAQSAYTILLRHVNSKGFAPMKHTQNETKLFRPGVLAKTLRKLIAPSKIWVYIKYKLNKNMETDPLHADGKNTLKDDDLVADDVRLREWARSVIDDELITEMHEAFKKHEGA